jgi:hypothetical protein
VFLIYHLPDMWTPDGFTSSRGMVSGVEQGKQCVVCLYHCTTTSDNVDKQHYQC